MGHVLHAKDVVYIHNKNACRDALWMLRNGRDLSPRGQELSNHLKAVAGPALEF